MRSLNSWDNRAEAVKFMSSPILIYRTASTKSWNMVCCGILFITVAVLRIWSITKSQVSSQRSWAGCGAWSGRGRGWKNALHLSFHAVWNKFVWVCVCVSACVCVFVVTTTMAHVSPWAAFHRISGYRRLISNPSCHQRREQMHVLCVRACTIRSPFNARKIPPSSLPIVSILDLESSKRGWTVSGSIDIQESLKKN